MDGLLHATIQYRDALMATKGEISRDDYDGESWRETMTNLKDDGIALPLKIAFDVETRNAFSSHAGNNSVGGIHATTCFPPNCASKLKSILVIELFRSKDRKRLGNDPILSNLIHELIKIRKHGIKITVKGKVYEIYLILSLVLGDNLRVNSLLAYTSSFTNTYCCRICEASPDGIRGMVREISKLIRTKEKYESDILQNCTSRGLTGYSLFNEVPDFHVLKAYVDVMHDVFEGVVPTVMSKILIVLIVNEKCVKVKDINDAFDKFDSILRKVTNPSISSLST
ncbi:hypothetical protein QAD02_007902 [Eretmocerus hayati]|uniref:Uncharacterized protein n=1 Tax=Eretmocerus hayati TaxID=131215 RepID=A0ACC2N9B9_9HYME|nr:hypothetical protein QAD02_007902 [Eretmocerus hayati]